MADTAVGAAVGDLRTITRSTGAPLRAPRVQGAGAQAPLVRDPGTAFVFIWYFGFIALAGYAPDFMGERLIDGFTVGYVLALTQFVMTWVLGWRTCGARTGCSTRSRQTGR